MSTPVQWIVPRARPPVFEVPRKLPELFLAIEWLLHRQPVWRRRGT